MEEESFSPDFQSLSLSKRLVRSFSQKLKRKSHGGENGDERISLTCLSLYGRNGGCKVGADTGEECEDLPGGRKSCTSEQGKGYYNKTSIHCFPYEKFWKRINNKVLEEKRNMFLPDEILELCLVRLPLTSLMNARLVCKRWNNLSATSRFIKMRKDGLFQTPWLFLFGVIKDGYCSGEIHALDVSNEKWYKLDSQVLKGRFLYSIASIQDNVYIIGGCSSLTNFGKIDRSSCKTHKSVTVFNTVTKSWRKAPSMKYARSSPILGISEVSSEFLVFRNQENQLERRSYRSYKDDKMFILIAVGGLGFWDEPLKSGEIYDSVSNKWTEIQNLPIEFGIACSGVICNGIFYVYSEIDKLVAYDIERGYWVEIHTTSFTSRVHEYYPKLICCNNNRLFMVSVSWCEGEGKIGRRNKAVRKLWEFDFVCVKWYEVSMHPDAPMDWNAVFVADKNLIFGVEMFKIFGQLLDFSTMFDVSALGTNWSHISRNDVARELDATSCVTKSMTVLHL